MNKYKTTKYMTIFTTIGYIIGFGMIILYSIKPNNFILPIAGVIIIFAGRMIGYAIDRTIEYLNERKK